jgi:hypothetical protein
MKSFQTGNSSNPSCFHIFFLIALFEETFIINITIVLYVNYTLIVCINNNAVINNNHRTPQDLILFFKTPMGNRKNFFEIWARALEKFCQPSHNLLAAHLRNSNFCAVLRARKNGLEEMMLFY